MKKIVLLVCALLFSGDAVAAENPTPYEGWQDRTIKALSPQEIDDLRDGRGMGLALAAELNSYPGPRHVLDLAERLGLSGEQREAVQTIFDGMQREARRLGALLLQRESALDAAFRDGQADAAGLRSDLEVLAALEGELRFVHLRSHLAVRDLLSAEQVVRYNALRGYDTAANGPHQHGGHGSATR